MLPSEAKKLVVIECGQCLEPFWSTNPGQQKFCPSCQRKRNKVSKRDYSRTVVSKVNINKVSGAFTNV